MADETTTTTLPLLDAEAPAPAPKAKKKATVTISPPDAEYMLAELRPIWEFSEANGGPARTVLTRKLENFLLERAQTPVKKPKPKKLKKDEVGPTDEPKHVPMITAPVPFVVPDPPPKVVPAVPEPPPLPDLGSVLPEPPGFAEPTVVVGTDGVPVLL